MAGVYGELENSIASLKNDNDVQLYDVDKVIGKMAALPGYVIDNMKSRNRTDPGEIAYENAILDKWAKRNPETKKFTETTEMIFYRAALLAADGLKKNDPTIDVEKKTREIYDKFQHGELMINTPYMANGGHRIFAQKLEDKLKDTADESMKIEIAQSKMIKQQLFACFVLPMYDSRQSIFHETLPMAVDIQASVGGTGFNFSNLRQANELIYGTGGTTDGPVSFMASYSTVLGKNINQGGKREGANMFMLDANHADIMRFIYSKRQDGEVASANISVAIDHYFMKAALAEKEEDQLYPVVNPHFNPEKRPGVTKFYTKDQLKRAMELVKTNRKATASLILAENGVDVLSPWLSNGMEEKYKVVGKVGEDGVVYLNAKHVMKHLSHSSWFNGEPGVIFTETINDKNPTSPVHYRDFLIEQTRELKEGRGERILPFARDVINGLGLDKVKDSGELEKRIESYVFERDESGKYVNLPIGVGWLRATNPCGEKPLLPNESCDLGHVGLEKILVRSDKTDSGFDIDWNKLDENVGIVYSLLDNAIDQNEFTHPDIERTQKSNRKIGLGVMGLAGLLQKLEIAYDSPEAEDLVDKIMGRIERVSDELSFQRGETMGAFPNFEYSSHRNGRKKRNAITRTIAPTGITATASRSTYGIEPDFALMYTRKTVQGVEMHFFNEAFAEKLEKYNFLRGGEEAEQGLKTFLRNEGHGSLGGFTISREKGESEAEFAVRQRNLDKMKRIFVTAHDIAPEWHVRIQAKVQKYVDDAISKTINFRNNATVEDIEKTFLLAYQLGVKGLTFYRDGTRKGQPLQVGNKRDDAVEGQVKKSMGLEELTQALIARINRPRPEVLGTTKKVKTPYAHSAFLTVNYEKDENGNFVPYEAIANLGKDGTDLSAQTEGYGRLISLLIKAGVPIDMIAESIADISGTTQENGIKKGKSLSLPDALSKALKAADESYRAQMGQVIERKDKVEKSAGNLCERCGCEMIFAEGCQRCSNINCGNSKCG